jgi:hypothetical protein
MLSSVQHLTDQTLILKQVQDDAQEILKPLNTFSVFLYQL